MDKNLETVLVNIVDALDMIHHNLKRLDIGKICGDSVHIEKQIRIVDALIKEVRDK